MESTNFADYILSEKKLAEKMNILYYFKKKQECFFDNTVIFKTELARMFLEHSEIKLDHNLILTACLLYGCKKTAIAFDLKKVKTYAKEGSQFLAVLGFDKRFCTICKQVNRYEDSTDRLAEGDLLEVIDNFGMLLDREDRREFTPTEAVFILEHENLVGKENQYLEDFKEFVMEFENIESLGLDKNRIISNWQKKINSIPKYDVVAGISLAIENRTEAKKMYIEGKKIQTNKGGIRDQKQKLHAKRRLEQELAKEIDKKHKFSDLLDPIDE